MEQEWHFQHAAAANAHAVKKNIMIEIQNLLFFVLPRWIVYTHWAPKALDVRDVGCRAILAHQLYTDKVGAMETLVPLSSPGFVIPTCYFCLVLTQNEFFNAPLSASKGNCFFLAE